MDVFDQPLAFVDLETTGGSHFTSRVLEVGVVRVERGQVVRTYQTLLYPDEPIPPFITGLTGITNDDVQGRPRFDRVADELAEILDGAVFVAHNVRFDYGFLRMEFGRLGVPFNPPLLCTVRLSRRLFPQFRTHKLADLILRHNLTAPSRHRAYDDATCLWQFWRMCLAEFDLDTLDLAVKAQLSSQALPSQLDPAQVAALPEGPGVYVFEDEAGAVLYVGKSVTVRRRVMSHFSADHEHGKELKLAQLVKRLRAIPTPGELSALLLESDLIKELQPLYNRALRRRERVTLLLQEATEAGYATVAVREARDIDPALATRILAVYTTAGQAKRSLEELCYQYRLCPKLLGLERSRRSCFASQLGRCAGACAGTEAAQVYNGRFEAAFASHRVAVWPYRGPILITEQQSGSEDYVGFVVNQWCLLAKLEQHEGGATQVTPEIQRFDLDRYKIIRQYVSGRQMSGHVSELTADQLAGLELQYS
jgi:DNA polymerase III subunit epsilon